VIVGAVFLAAPFVVGMRIARVRSWVAWAAVTILVLFAVYAWVVFSLDPANAEFYVSLGDDGTAFLDSR
jgi:hypothetical protein